MKTEWNLVKDESDNPLLSLYHYEPVEIDDSTKCCEFWDQVRECLECSKEGGPDDGKPVRWHSALHCPFCRGDGVPVDKV